MLRLPWLGFKKYAGVFSIGPNMKRSSVFVCTFQNSLLNHATLNSPVLFTSAFVSMSRTVQLEAFFKKSLMGGFNLLIRQLRREKPKEGRKELKAEKKQVMSPISAVVLDLAEPERIPLSVPICSTFS